VDSTSIASTTSAEPVRGATDLDDAWWRIVAAWILIAAAMLRFYAIDLKPLHHDEGVNGFFLVNLIRSSAGYRYDPANYHGPSLYYFARASVALMGLSTVAIRVVPALFGMISVCLLLAWRSRLGAIGSLAAAALLALSPGAVYMSRYFIHEALLVCFTLAVLLSVDRYVVSRRSRDLIAAGAGLGLMFATKETAIISLGIAAIACGGVVVLQRVESGRRTGQDQRRTGLRFGTREALSLCAAIGAFIAIIVVLFSSFFAHLEAVPDALKSFAFWARTGTAAHVHPMWTYLWWMLQEESMVLAFGFSGVAVALIRRDNTFALFAALWAVGTLIAYSLVPYKTPWLTLNLIAPLAVIGGYGADRLWAGCHGISRFACIGMAVGACAVSTIQSVNLNFVHYDDPAYPYVYVHTQRDLLRLVRDVEAIDNARPSRTARLHVTVTSSQQFPLSWYFRNFLSWSAASSRMKISQRCCRRHTNAAVTTPCGPASGWCCTCVADGAVPSCHSPIVTALRCFRTTPMRELALQTHASIQIQRGREYACSGTSCRSLHGFLLEGWEPTAKNRAPFRQERSN
jgi:uncharacterized protein (TIGR03663 family)